MSEENEQLLTINQDKIKNVTELQLKNSLDTLAEKGLGSSLSDDLVLIHYVLKKYFLDEGIEECAWQDVMNKAHNLYMNYLLEQLVREGQIEAIFDTELNRFVFSKVEE
jgi:hypothetical protein